MFLLFLLRRSVVDSHSLSLKTPQSFQAPSTSILLNTQLGSFLTVSPACLPLPAPAPTTRIGLTHPFPLWEGGSRVTDRWNAASMCLFIACITATGCCCGGRTGVKGLTQPALPGRVIYLSQQLWGGEGRSPLGQRSGWKMNTAQPARVHRQGKV